MFSKLPTVLLSVFAREPALMLPGAPQAPQCHKFYARPRPVARIGAVHLPIVLVSQDPVDQRLQHAIDLGEVFTVKAHIHQLSL